MSFLPAKLQNIAIEVRKYQRNMKIYLLSLLECQNAEMKKITQNSYCFPLDFLCELLVMSSKKVAIKLWELQPRGNWGPWAAHVEPAVGIWEFGNALTLIWFSRNGSSSSFLPSFSLQSGGFGFGVRIRVGFCFRLFIPWNRETTGMEEKELKSTHRENKPTNQPKTKEKVLFKKHENC